MEKDLAGRRNGKEAGFPRKQVVQGEAGGEGGPEAFEMLFQV